MIFKNVKALTEFFGVSGQTFYFATSKGKLHKVGKTIDSKDSRNWKYLYKYALKKKLDIYEFFGSEFDPDNLDTPKKKKQSSDKSKPKANEKSDSEGNQEDQDKELAGYLKRKTIAEAILKEEQAEEKRLRNAEKKNLLLDKEIVHQTFKIMLELVDESFLGSVEKGAGEDFHRLSIDLKNSSMRESIIEFKKMFGDKIQDSRTQFFEKYKEALEKLWGESDE